MKRIAMKKMRVLGSLVLLSMLYVAGCSDYADEYKKDYKEKYGSVEVVPGEVPSYNWDCPKDAESCVELWRAYNGTDFGLESTMGTKWGLLTDEKSTVDLNAVDDNGRPYTIDVMPNNLTPLLRLGGISGKTSISKDVRSPFVSLYVGLKNGTLETSDYSGLTIALASTSSFYISLYEMKDGKVVSEYRTKKALSSMGSSIDEVSSVNVWFQDFECISGERDLKTFLGKVNAAGITFTETQAGEKDGFSIVGVSAFKEKTAEEGKGPDSSAEDESSASESASSSSVDESSSSVENNSSSVDNSSSSAANSSSSVDNSSSSEEVLVKWLWRGDENNTEGIKFELQDGLRARYPLSTNYDVDQNSSRKSDGLQKIEAACNGYCGRVVDESSDGHNVNKGFRLVVFIGKDVDKSNWKGLCLGVEGEDVDLMNAQKQIVRTSIGGSGKLKISNFTWDELNFARPSSNTELIFAVEKMSGDASGSYVNVQAIGSYGSCEDLNIADNELNKDNIIYPLDKESHLYLNVNLSYGNTIDERDNQSYQTYDINGIKWFAENLNYKIPSSSKDVCGGPDGASGKGCERYGRLYRQSELKDACPDGWHVATTEEWASLGESQKGLITQNAVFEKTNGADNSTGLSLIPAGYFNGSAVEKLGYGLYWHEISAGNYQVFDGGRDLVTESLTSEDDMYSVRCVYGELTESSSSSGGVVTSSSIESTCEGTVLYNAEWGDQQPMKWEAYCDPYENCAVGNVSGTYTISNMFANIGSDGDFHDISHWGGLCITYKSSGAEPALKLLNDEMGVYHFDIPLSASEDYRTESVSFEYSLDLQEDYEGFARVLKVEQWSESPVPSSFQIYKITTLNELYGSIAGEKVDVCDNHIKYDSGKQFCGSDGKVYDKCGEEEFNPEKQFCGDDRAVHELCGGEPYSVSTEMCNYENKVVTRCEKSSTKCFYWNGKEAAERKKYGTIVNGQLLDDAVHFYSEDEFQWPVDVYCYHGSSEGAQGADLNSVVDYCNGICAKLSSGDGNKPNEVTFPINEMTVKETNIAEWKGLCVTYASDQDAYIRLDLDDKYTNQKGWNYPVAKLPATQGNSINTVCTEWSFFKDSYSAVSGEYDKVGTFTDMDQALGHPHNAVFTYLDVRKKSVNFTVYEIGSIDQCMGAQNGGFELPNYAEMEWRPALKKDGES